MTHKWMNWQSLVLNGRIRRKGIEQPSRERVQVRKALSLLGLRYKELVPIINRDWHGWKGKQTEGAIQWFDFLYLMPNKRMGAILFDPHFGRGGLHPHEIARHEAKKMLMKKRGIPTLEVKRTLTVGEYALIIKKHNERSIR
jgi:hypothetical protein